MNHIDLSTKRASLSQKRVRHTNEHKPALPGTTSTESGIEPDTNISPVPRLPSGVGNKPHPSYDSVFFILQIPAATRLRWYLTG